MYQNRILVRGTVHADLMGGRIAEVIDSPWFVQVLTSSLNVLMCAVDALTSERALQPGRYWTHGPKL